MLLEGEIALVTGGSRGIGRACCLALAEAGAEVIVNYRKGESEAKAVCEEIRKSGGKAISLGFDVSNPAEIDASIGKILGEKKSLSILVNNSGITHDGLMARYSVEDWDRVLDTNLRGAFLVSQAVLRPMMKARKGSIIHMSSVVGVIGNPGQAAYCASKAGLIGLTKSMARELGTRNIRVNAVAPGFIQTEMTEKLSEEQKQQLSERIPLQALGTAEQVAQAVVFLASSKASYITGQVLCVDGGMAM